MHYSIRLAQRADVSQLPAIERAAAQRYIPYLDTLELTTDLLADIATVPYLLRAQTHQRLWVAVLDSDDSSLEIHNPPQSERPDILGFVLTRPLIDSFFIVELDVLPNYGRLGIGTALMKTACEAGAMRGFNCITLTTFRYIPWTIPFYRGLGFEIIPPEDWNSDLTAIVEHEERHGFKRKHRVVMQAIFND